MSCRTLIGDNHIFLTFIFQREIEDEVVEDKGGYVGGADTRVVCATHDGFGSP